MSRDGRPAVQLARRGGMGVAELRFLVVEDHAFQRATVLALLAQLGAQHLLEAGDGEAALRALRQAQPPVDVVITDLDMPGMDGVEFIRALAAEPRPPSVVALSAVDDAVLAAVESMASVHGVPLLGVLSKPLTPAALLDVIARHEARHARPAFSAAPARRFADDEIRAGLDSDAFEPFFQPKVALADGTLHGFEALARWRHPVAGIVGPQDFIEVLEDRGWIDELTWAMLEKSAACCMQWPQAGRELSVAVNLSLHSVANERLVDRLTAIAAAQGLAPRRLVLELTESAAAGERLAQVLGNLARLRLKGFGLAIDDFGTGYSSVQQLSRVAFTELKIDRSFVRDAVTREPALIVLQASLEMARRMKLTSVAEGVETAAEWNLLRDLGCDLAQGYRVARPMQASQVAAWIGAHAAADFLGRLSGP